MWSIRAVLLQAGSALKPLRELRSRQTLLMQNCGGVKHSYVSFLSPVLECRHRGIRWTVHSVQLHAERQVNLPAPRTGREAKSIKQSKGLHGWFYHRSIRRSCLVCEAAPLSA